MTILNSNVILAALDAANQVDHEDHDTAVQVALIVAAPLIEAQAKAEALRYEADALDKLATIQDHWRGADYLDGVNAARTEAADWLRARAATIEGKDS